ncbi:MAG TPA: YdcF family protein [Trichocoleus sp.]|jgi:uncharacterized SAM-binding protein YcdF (DUF218 family)
MIDPSVCPNDATGRWTFFTWTIFDLLVSPHLILPPLLILIFLPWLLRPLRYKGLISGSGLLLLLVYLLVGSPIALAPGNQILTRFLPEDPGTKTDAIVVLGRGSELRQERVQIASQLWQAKRAPFIFASGSGDAIEIVDSLKQSGIPPQAIDGEPCSRTTEENAQFTAALLQPRGVKRILLVTDPPHMLRSFLTYRSLGFEVIPHLNPLPSQLAERKEAFLLVREYFGLMSYGLKGRFFRRSLDPNEQIFSGLTPRHQVQ